MRPYFFRKAAVPIKAQTSGQAEVGAKLKFVLNIGPSLTSAVIAVCISLKKFCSRVVVVGGDKALHELGKIRRPNDALVGSCIAGIKLSVGIAAAKCDGVCRETRWHSPKA
jgi:hypothetical protein